MHVDLLTTKTENFQWKVFSSTFIPIDSKVIGTTFTNNTDFLVNNFGEILISHIYLLSASYRTLLANASKV